MGELIDRVLKSFYDRTLEPARLFLNDTLNKRGRALYIVLLHATPLIPVAVSIFIAAALMSSAFEERRTDTAGNDEKTWQTSVKRWMSQTFSSDLTSGFVFSEGAIVFCEEGWSSSDVILARSLKEYGDGEEIDVLPRAQSQAPLLILSLRERESPLDLSSNRAPQSATVELDYSKAEAEDTPRALRLVGSGERGSDVAQRFHRAVERRDDDNQATKLEMVFRETGTALIGTPPYLPAPPVADATSARELKMFKLTDNAAADLYDAPRVKMNCGTLSHGEFDLSQRSGVALIDRGQTGDITFVLIFGLLLSFIATVFLETLRRLIDIPEEDDRDDAPEEV